MGVPRYSSQVLRNTGDQLIADVHRTDTRDLLFAGVLRSVFGLSWSQNCFPAVLCWDLGLFYFIGCCLVNSCGGLFRWIHLALDSTWEGAPCQVGTRLVKLAGLSSKSTCNICCIWSSGCSFGSCIPVSSLQYQLIGKLLGSGSFSQ